MRTKIIRANGTELQQIKSCTYTQDVNGNTDLRAGCVSSASISVEAFGSQTDAPVNGERLTYYQVDDENNETQIGVFYAEPSITTKNSYSFVAYDAVKKMDVDFSEHLATIQADFPMTLMEIVEEAADVANVTLASGISFPLSTLSVNAFSQSGITCRQILGWAAEIACRFVRCNANGEIIFDWYTTSSNVIAPSDTNGAIYYKQDGLTYEKYNTAIIDRVMIHPLYSSDIAYIYPLNITSGNTYIITDNILLTNASEETYNIVAQNIYNVLTALGTYRPFNVQLFPFNNPFRVGDKVVVTDSQGVTFNTIIMSMIITENSATLSSTGNEIYSNVSSSLSEIARESIINYNDFLDQMAIFNKLTNNGITQGIYIQNRIDEEGHIIVDEDGNPIKDLYINMSYARTGILQLGGSNNSLGIAQILDENDNVISQWDRIGLRASAVFIDGSSNGLASAADSSYIIIPTDSAIAKFRATYEYIPGSLYHKVLAYQIRKNKADTDTYHYFLEYLDEESMVDPVYYYLGTDNLEHVNTNDYYYCIGDTVSKDNVHLPNRKDPLIINHPDFISEDPKTFAGKLWNYEEDGEYSIKKGHGQPVEYSQYSAVYLKNEDLDKTFAITSWESFSDGQINKGSITINKNGLKYDSPIKTESEYDPLLKQNINMNFLYSKTIVPIPPKDDPMWTDVGKIVEAASAEITGISIKDEYIDSSGNIEITGMERKIELDLDEWLTMENHSRSVNISPGLIRIEADSQSLLTFKSTAYSSNADVDIPTDNNKLFGGFNVLDANDNECFYVQASKTTNDVFYSSYILKRQFSNGTVGTMGFYQRIHPNGAGEVVFTNYGTRDAWANGLNVVKKAGDTMTGALNFDISYIDITESYTADKYQGWLTGRDANGNIICAGHLIKTKDADLATRGIGFQWEAWRTISDTTYKNALRLLVDGSGRAVVEISGLNVQNAWRTALGAVNKAGDTMTGALVIQRDNASGAFYYTLNNLDTTTTVTSAVYRTALTLRGRAGTSGDLYNGGLVEYVKMTGGNGLSIAGARHISNEYKFNALRLLVDASGNAVVSISGTGAASSWCNALGVGTRLSAYLTTSTTLAPGSTYTNLISLTLPAGIWVVIAAVTMQQNGAAVGTYVSVALGSTDTGSQYARAQVGSSTGNTTLQVSTTLNLTASTTVYLNAFQGSTVTRTVPSGELNTYIVAVRIASR